MADNTKQFRWSVTIQDGVDGWFQETLDVLVAGDLLWYPVAGPPEISTVPIRWWSLGVRREIEAPIDNGKKPRLRRKWSSKWGPPAIQFKVKGA